MSRAEKKKKSIGPPFARENEITFGISFSNPQAAPSQQQGCKSILFWFVLCQMEQVNKEQLEQIISTEIPIFFSFSFAFNLCILSVFYIKMLKFKSAFRLYFCFLFFPIVSHFTCAIHYGIQIK